MDISKGSHYVFSRPMLATWAGCCILVGISTALVCVSQGWLNLDSSKEQNSPAETDDSNNTELVQKISAQLLQSTAARQCLDNPDEWKRVPYVWPRSDLSRKDALLTGSLLAPDKLAVEPVTFMHKDRKQFVVVVHLGKNTCGHKGIVHGGILATLFDEITGRPAFWNLPRNVALTASLKISYRRPAIADQVFVFRTQLTGLDGRKAEVVGQLEDAQGNLLSEAEALYISPKDDLVPDRSSQIEKVENFYPGRF
ncbi:hypothetical protein IWW51_003134 [Coemansia sp. RSA 2702]|nr:hypothetical protein IWW52_003977 [Coemansia sp. RSA 2704]KAJ2324734.1 hypothetical protein IWW51_003134 [Coemansia sp. RSA 2702]KAJ2366446.1 hypothetical protein H4S01_002706 [Coemansia sp. RSA 2610]KAJ2727419.1 hypothetical protein H4R23_003900 [Coemansia sp. Cherry 401B]